MSTTEADLLGSAMAKAAGRAARVLEERIKRLEWQLGVAEQPHTIRCTQLWDTCTCGLREVMEDEKSGTPTFPPRTSAQR